MRYSISPDLLGKHATTPLHLAAQEGQLNTVELLIENRVCNPLCITRASGNGKRKRKAEMENKRKS